MQQLLLLKMRQLHGVKRHPVIRRFSRRLGVLELDGLHGLVIALPDDKIQNINHDNPGDFCRKLIRLGAFSGFHGHLMGYRQEVPVKNAGIS
jgi:hypothetical protein